MPDPSTTTRPSLREAVAAAIRALQGDRLAVLPTETVYGVACRASSPAALARLASIQTTPASAARTWHAPSTSDLLRAAPLASPLHRRIADRLTPGPVRLLIERPGDLERVRATLGVPAGVVDDGAALQVRVPDSAITRDILTQVGGTVILLGLSQVGLGDGSRPPSPEQALALGIDAVVDDGPARFGRPSSSLRLTADGGYTIDQVGAISEANLRSRIERSILLVCTGNTCRSPMAEAIARDVLSHRAPLGPGRKHVPVRVASAGVAASQGDGMTPEAVQALRALGVDPGTHRSRPLTGDLGRSADAIWAMTASHARAAVALGADRHKITLLDPDGTDIPDPIGGAAAVYLATARHLRDLLTRRLQALDAQEETP